MASVLVNRSRSLGALAIGFLAFIAFGAAWAARPGRGAEAAALIERIRADASASTVTETPLAKAAGALERAQDLHAAGDHEQGALLEAVALEWAETAAALKETAKLEEKLAETQQRAAEAETKALRAKALLEQTVARRGRAQVRLEDWEADAGPERSEAER